ncbi:MAG: sigma-70 family RNA polymerase sigma factor [Clostridiales bacterium]|nr:sigma-70 family RNA polymerase sigma factor [Clostridiales bacterium]
MDNTLLAYKLAHDFKSKYSVANIDIEDLCSMAVVGLCNAARLYDPENGAKFATYAGRAIWNEMIREITHSGEPTCPQPVLSLEGYIYSASNNDVDLDIKLEDVLSDNVDIANDVTLHISLHTLIASKLTDTEKRIIQLRYFTNDKPMPHWKVGKVIGLSKQRVSELERRALQKLRLELV